MIDVELFGMARAIAGEPVAHLAQAESLTMCELANALADAYPNMRGVVVDDEGFIAPHHVLLDGRRAPRPEERFSNDDRPCVLLLASGG